MKNTLSNNKIEFIGCYFTSYRTLELATKVFCSEYDIKKDSKSLAIVKNDDDESFMISISDFKEFNKVWITE